MGRTIHNRVAQVQITGRDLAIFRKLGAAGWLTAEQIRNYFFPCKTTNAVSKRMRKLVGGKYLAMARQSLTEPGLYRLAGRGKLALLEHADPDEAEAIITTQFPRKLHHFMAVNDLRYFFDQLTASEARLCYFFSEQEFWRSGQYLESDLGGLLALLRYYRLIPDAIAKVRMARDGIISELNVLIEYDAGTEHASFFGRTKIRQYAALWAENQERIGEIKVLTFAPTVRRLVSLMRQTVVYQAPPQLFYFAPVGELEGRQWEATDLFLDPYDFFLPVRRGAQVEIHEKEISGGVIPKYSLLTLPAGSPYRVSPREEKTNQAKAI